MKVKLTEDEKWDEERLPVRLRHLYRWHREGGGNHKFSMMVVLQQPPGCNTDKTFMRGYGGTGNEFDGHFKMFGDVYRKKAEKAGVSVNGARYMGGLARYPGDPEAWIRGKGDIVRVCEKRGASCEGAVTVKAPETRPEDPRKGLKKPVFRMPQ